MFLVIYLFELVIWTYCGFVRGYYKFSWWDVKHHQGMKIHSGHEFSTLHKGQVEMLKSVYLSCFTTLCNVQDQIFRMCLALLINIYSCKSITLHWSLNYESTSAIITIILLYLQVRTSARQSVRSKHVHDTSTKGKIFLHVCHNNCSK